MCPKPPKIRDGSVGYSGTGTPERESEPRSDSLAGIGTRISAAAKAMGSRIRAAEAMGISTDSLQRYIREEVQAPFAPVARLALASGVSLQWLATGAGPQRAADEAASSQELSADTLSIALELVDDLVRRSVGWLPRRDYAELVLLVLAMRREQLAIPRILAIVEAELKRMAKGEKNDAGRAGVGGESAPGAEPGRALLPGEGKW